MRTRDDDHNDHDPLTESIIGAAIEVHRVLGPGLLESAYAKALCVELAVSKLSYEQQVSLPVMYRGIAVGEYRADLVVERQVVVEIKSVEQLAGVHRAQLIAYMRVLRLHTGLLINFNGEVLRTGVRRVVL